VDTKDAPISHQGLFNFEMVFGAGHSAHGEGLFSILNASLFLLIYARLSNTLMDRSVNKRCYCAIGFNVPHLSI